MEYRKGERYSTWAENAMGTIDKQFVANRQLVNLVEDEYEVKVADSRREFAELLKVEFEWVGQDEDGLI